MPTMSFACATGETRPNGSAPMRHRATSRRVQTPAVTDRATSRPDARNQKWRSYLSWPLSRFGRATAARIAGALVQPPDVVAVKALISDLHPWRQRGTGG